MIDLRKPLEGVPGLLLMAALIFFGATIGIAVALGFTWIPMSDALANFLGGVVGAGLGAALAVMGAVYVQRRERRHQLEGAINSMQLKAELLSDLLKRLGNALKVEPAKSSQLQSYVIQALVSLIEEEVQSLPSGAELSSDIHTRALMVKQQVPLFIIMFKKHLEGELDPPAELMTAIKGTAAQADEIVKRVRALAH